MKLHLVAAISLGSTAMLSASAADAAPVMVTLGASAQNLTLYGLGPSGSNPALGTFGIGQGSSVYDIVTNRSTFTLSGAITGGTAGYNSGTYSFVTSYAGLNTPLAGPNEPTGQSNPNDITRFFYTFIDPSTTITLTLFLGNRTVTQQLFANDDFVANTGFSFTFAGSPTCTGVAVCTQNNVGLTRGATIFGPTTISASFNVADAAVPEPASWAMMVAGFGAVGLALRRRQRAATRFAYTA